MPDTPSDQHTRRRHHRAEIGPSAIGGALTIGAAAGLTLGPLGAAAGLVVGAAAGELLDRRVKAQQDQSSRTATRKATHC